MVVVDVVEAEGVAEGVVEVDERLQAKGYLFAVSLASTYYPFVYLFDLRLMRRCPRVLDS